MRHTYRELSVDVDWELFKQRPSICDVVPPSESALRQILPLDENACSIFWRTIVTPDADCVWYRQLPQNHWAKQLNVHGPNWHSFFDKWHRPDPVVAFLNSQLNWQADQSVYFVRSKLYVLQTQWSIFTDHWRSFLFSDDDPFLLAVNKPGFALIGDSGVLAIGERPISQELDLESTW